LLQAKIAVIGGTGLEELLENGVETRVGTPFGPSPTIIVGKIEDRIVAFLPRHGMKHEVPPHRVNYRANVWSLKELGVERIIATNAVGAINKRFKPGDFVIPHDLVDFTKARAQTYYDEAPVTHIDVTEPYCPELRSILIKSSRGSAGRTWTKAVLACTEGPRYETPAEIKMLKIVGCDIVGMTGFPEAFLARELEICYATICFVSNMAAGIQRRLTAEEVIQIGKKVLPTLRLTIKNAVRDLPSERRCACSRALEKARI
jgi:5'-methylthioadenosine phosphorylase